MHCAGPPCTDFSAMGRRQDTDGHTMGPLLAWCKMVRSCRPCCVIVENVVRFPLALLRSLFADLYALWPIVLDPTALGWPVRRKCRYVLMTLRRVAVLDRPAVELLNVLGSKTTH